MTSDLKAGTAPLLRAQLAQIFGRSRERPWSFRLSSAGWAAAAMGMAGLGSIQFIFAIPLPDLQLVALPAWMARFLGASLAICSLLMLVRRDRLAAGAVACLWGGFAAISFAMVATGGSRSLPSWVPFAELLIFTSALLAGPVLRREKLVALFRAAWGSTLLLFGAIHLVYREAIASLIPGWIPAAQFWPMATGAFQLAAGAAVLAGRGSSTAMTLVGVMYLSWLPLVHAPRLMADPSSPQEWTFAAIALSLAGCALLLAGKGEPASLRSEAEPRA